MEPGIDGLETYKRILRIKPGQKAVIASGYSESGRVLEAQRLGEGLYIKKPYNLESISVAVRTELDA
jgi:two-component system cell cycle sensor histidine kinase/response regulator CckA